MSQNRPQTPSAGAKPAVNGANQQRSIEVVFLDPKGETQTKTLKGRKVGWRVHDGTPGAVTLWADNKTLSLPLSRLFHAEIDGN